MTRVDCASTINSNLCDKFSVDHYPMLFWGPPKKFVGGGWGPNQEKSEILPIENGRTADVLLGWINKQLGSSYGLDDGKYENEHLQTNTSDPGQIAKAIYDVEEATSTAFSIILDHKMIKPETRASLIKFLQLLVAHHPSRRCRKGSADVLVNFDDLCPSSTMLVNNEEAESCSKKGAIGNYQICGKEVPRGYWMYCRGSKNDTRGFSCGLWVLLHSLSVRVEDGESNMAFRSACDFIHNFFVCEECRQHFYEMCLSVSTPFKKARDFALWLWRAHNQVNKRLIKEEASLGTGDPEFPKAIWPPKQLCSSCYLSPSKTSEENNKIDWDEDEVFKFLVSYYGKELVTLYKDNEQQGGGKTEKIVAEELVASTNAVVVPVGAALAIAVASCAFGALAYIWRSRQKNRKYKYIYSLKNI
ncbi:sulfhydryl oxidase 2 isoform X3 [Nicotiana tabacum]|nr:PREDICTED: sulfhydryl oxidase 2-like isoform X3 [Nicotiana tabacum]